MTDVYVACERSTGIREEGRHYFLLLCRARGRRNGAFSVPFQYFGHIAKEERFGKNRAKDGNQITGVRRERRRKIVLFFAKDTFDTKTLSSLREESHPNKSFRETSNSSKALRKSLDEAFSRFRLLYLRASSLYRHSALYYLTSREKYMPGKKNKLSEIISNHIFTLYS